jgi:acyl carrier protein
MATRDRVRQYITETAWIPDDIELTDDLSLIDSGLVDSTGMMDVILWIETTFGFHVADEEITPNNLETVARIAAFIDRRSVPSER